MASGVAITSEGTRYSHWVGSICQELCPAESRSMGE